MGQVSGHHRDRRVLHLRAPVWCTKVLFNLKSLFLNKKKLPTTLHLQFIFHGNRTFLSFCSLLNFLPIKFLWACFHINQSIFECFAVFLYVYISFRIGKMREILRLHCKIFEFCESENSFIPI